jgi:hypothetical protein
MCILGMDKTQRRVCTEAAKNKALYSEGLIALRVLISWKTFM